MQKKAALRPLFITFVDRYQATCFLLRPVQPIISMLSIIRLIMEGSETELSVVLPLMKSFPQFIVQCTSSPAFPLKPRLAMSKVTMRE